MSVGVVHWGSRYIEERRSRRRGRVGFEGGEMLEVSKMEIISSVALVEVRSGRLILRALSRAGMKSRRAKGASKFMLRLGRVGKETPVATWV